MGTGSLLLVFALGLGLGGILTEVLRARKVSTGCLLHVLHVLHMCHTV